MIIPGEIHDYEEIPEEEENTYANIDTATLLRPQDTTTALLSTTSLRDRITKWFSKRKGQNTPPNIQSESLKTIQLLEKKIKILKSYATFHSNAYIKITNHIEAEELVLAKEKAKTLPRNRQPSQRKDTQTTKLRSGYFHPRALNKPPQKQPQHHVRTREIDSYDDSKPRFRTPEDEERFYQKLADFKKMLEEQKQNALIRNRLRQQEAFAKIEEKEKEDLKKMN